MNRFRQVETKAFCLSSGASAAAGFTLIEILVALAVVTITIAAVLESQLHSLKIEQKARILQLFRFETERIFSVTHRAGNERQLAELLATGRLCRIKAAPFQIEEGTNITNLIRYELNTDDLPSFSSVFFIRVPACSPRRTGDINNGFGSQRKE